MVHLPNVVAECRQCQFHYYVYDADNGQDVHVCTKDEVLQKHNANFPFIISTKTPVYPLEPKCFVQMDEERRRAKEIYLRIVTTLFNLREGKTSISDAQKQILDIIMSSLDSKTQKICGLLTELFGQGEGEWDSAIKTALNLITKQNNAQENKLDHQAIGI